MATYEIPHQKIKYTIPDTGETFQLSSQPGYVYKRDGNTLYTMEAETARKNGIDTNAIAVKDYNVADLMGVFNSSGFQYKGASWETNGGIANLSAFRTPSELKTGEVITRGISSTNPHDSTVSSNFSGVLKGEEPPTALAQQAAVQGLQTAFDPAKATQYGPQANTFNQNPQQPAPYAQTDPNQVINQTTGQTAGQMPVADPKALAASVNQQTKAIYEGTKGQDVDLRESEKIIRDLATKLTESAPPPKPLSMAEMFTTERQKLGLEPLENDLARLDAEADRITTAALVESDKQAERGVGQNVIDRVRGKISKEAQRELAFLNIERSAVAAQLNNKLNALQMTMGFTQQDYANATAAYNAEFSRSLQMIDLFTGLEDRTDAKEDKLADNARANLSTITNLLQSSGKAFTDMTPDQLRNVREWEVQAGYPSGTFEAFGSSKPQAKVLHTSSGTDAAGNQIVTFIYDDGTGKPGTTQVVKTGGRSSSSGGGSGTPAPSASMTFEQWKASPAGLAVRNNFHSATGSFNGLETALRAAYTTPGGPGFTVTEKKKLEQAGLLNAPRQQQLDHLYKGKDADPLDALIEAQISGYGS